MTAFKIIPDTTQSAEIKVISTTESSNISVTGFGGPQGTQGDQGIRGVQGVQGEPGLGIPSGGSDGQIIVKVGEVDYDVQWSDNIIDIQDKNLATKGNNENILYGIENQTVIDSFQASEWRMVKYTISASKNLNGVNKYSSTDLTILIDLIDINVTEYGTIDNNGDVGTVNVTKVGTTVNINYIPNLLITPVTVRYYRTGLKA